MDFGRIINKHAVQFAYPTQVPFLVGVWLALIMSSACHVRLTDTQTHSSTGMAGYCQAV